MVKLISKILLAILISLIVWILVREFYIKPSALKKGFSKYTIAIIISFTNPSDGGKVADFEYRVSGKVYSGFLGIEGRNIKMGDRYFIQYLYTDPQNAKILIKQPVPNSIISVPDDGWDKLPF
jgi:hypothetical protein